MTRLKRWICERFLPVYCREEMLAEAKRLQAEIVEIKRENERLLAYIDGMHAVLRRRQKITINATEESRHGRTVSHDEQHEDI